MIEPVICPTITATSESEYKRQMEQIKSFASRIHIDLMDGKFAETQSPSLKNIWWYDFMEADIHLMYEDPSGALDDIFRLKPALVVIHAEASVDHKAFASNLHDHGIKAGLALLQQTELNAIAEKIADFDHILIFSGNLGHHGGTADLGLLAKLSQARDSFPAKEIGWDGGINDTNIRRLLENGASVLNVGGFIQDSPDPFASYAKLKVAI